MNILNNIKNFYYKHIEIFKYLLVGMLTTCISLGIYYLCISTFLNAKIPIELQIANILSWICSVLFAFIANRIFVFNSKNKNKWRELLLFFHSRILTLLIDMFLMFILVTILSLNDKISKLVVQIIVIILNYILSKKMVFKKIKAK